MYSGGKIRYGTVTAHCIEPDWPAPPGVLALSTTRIGGVSTGVFAGYNLAAHVGDLPEAVAANRVRLLSGLPTGTAIRWLEQVHGAGVVEARGGGPAPRADACWTRSPGLACAVMTADCLPVLLSDRRGEVVAAAHAGWRGLLAGVLEAAVAAMGVAPSEILAWLGPAIGPGAFEVGPEVRSQFLESSLGDAAGRCFTPGFDKKEHYFADLYQLARLQLAACGVTRSYGSGFCTFSDPARFYSYRRDGQTGRMASLILIKPR